MPLLTLTTTQADVLADQVVLLLGVPDDSATRDRARSAVSIVAGMVFNYVRGNGFFEEETPENVVMDGALMAVVTTAAARLTANPHQVASESASEPLLKVPGASVPDTSSGPGQTGMGEQIAVSSHSYSGGVFLDFSPAEKSILHQFRVRNG